MLKPTSPLDDEGLDDLLAEDCDGAGDWPGGGLCCPDDPLDDVMGCFLPVLDYGSMEALGLGGATPQRPANGVEVAPPVLDAASGAPGAGVADMSTRTGAPEEDFDVGMFLANGTPGDHGGGACSRAAAVSSSPLVARVLRDQCGAMGVVTPVSAPLLLAHHALDGVVPRCAPPLLSGAASDVVAPLLPAHDALGGVPPVSAPLSLAHDARVVPQFAPPLLAHDSVDGTVPDSAPPLPWHDAVPARPPTTFSTASGRVPSMSWKTDPSARVSPLQVVPRKKRHGRVTRLNPFWLTSKSGLYDVPELADVPGDNKSGSNGAATSTPRQRRPEERKRNRQHERVCSHCKSKKTPQWRLGPQGPGTLCNPCGIRFKNGKLLEEYRPSTSPDFDSDKHSNRHRKVMKLRERKALQLTSADTVPVPEPLSASAGAA